MIWTALDLDAGGARTAQLPERCASVVHTAPLWLLPEWVPTWAGLGVRRVVALSSTSRTTKAASPDPQERAVARRLADAEEAVREACEGHGIHWTLLRPTLIYDGLQDENVAVIARFIRRFGVFPLAGRGSGLRQPVHASDIAAACLAVLHEERAFGRLYETPGGETLEYREMVQRIAQGVGRRVRLLHVPLPLLRAVLSAARHLPPLAHLTPTMANRMNEDLTFDASAARRDFGYRPGPFRPLGGP